MLDLEANLLIRFMSVYISCLNYIHQDFPFSSISAALKTKVYFLYSTYLKIVLTILNQIVFTEFSQGNFPHIIHKTMQRKLSYFHFWREDLPGE